MYWVVSNKYLNKVKYTYIGSSINIKENTCTGEYFSKYPLKFNYFLN